MSLRDDEDNLDIRCRFLRADDSDEWVLWEVLTVPAIEFDNGFTSQDPDVDIFDVWITLDKDQIVPVLPSPRVKITMGKR